MPCFSFVIHGTGIDIPGADDVPLIGFYRSEWVRAATVAEAQAKAIAAVAADWESGRYAACNRGAKPTLAVEGTWRRSLWSFLRHRNGGHAFYPAGDDDDGPSTSPSP